MKSFKFSRRLITSIHGRIFIWWSVILVAICAFKSPESSSVELIRTETVFTTIERFASADPVDFSSEAFVKEKKVRKKRSSAILSPVNVDINHADLNELCTIKGVGLVLAQRIIDYRNEHGLFSTVDELDSVKGIGLKTVEKLKIQKVWAGKK